MKTALTRTLDMMAGDWRGDNGRVNKGAAFVKRAKKSDARRRMEKKARQRMRRR